ncbi:hypothetical protein [Mariniblastus fucicola]|nr:hypothetical protein [Mariniblastus fucicola]
MLRLISTTGFFLLIALSVCNDRTWANDRVYLKTGRILQGKVTEGEAEKGGEFILLTTETGTVYKLDKGDIVKSVLMREKVDTDYKARLRLIKDVATDHIELAKWCEKQTRGKTRFKEQIRWHYENVIRLDPEHANARKKLGYMKLADGNWVAQAEFKTRQGYIPDRRRDWVAGLSKVVAEKDEAYDAKLGAKRKAFNRWLSAAEKGNLQPAVLADICDASTLDLVYQSALNAQYNVEACRVHLDAIATVKTGDAVEGLAHFAIEAPNQDIREHAISLLQSEVDHVTAILYLKGGLKFSNRWHVQNAAFAIAEIASTDDYSRDFAMLPLADSLRTQHEERIAGALAPGRMNTSFGSGGTSFQTGGGPQTQVKEYRNQQSLDALRRLFEADFGFDEQAWRNWYIQNYTLSDLTVRRDE